MSESHPTVRIGDEDVRITDPHSIIPVCGEVITEIRVIDGVLFLSLASHVVDGNGKPEARIVSRLRMPLGVVAGVANALDSIRDQTERAKKAAN